MKGKFAREEAGIVVFYEGGETKNFALENAPQDEIDIIDVKKPGAIDLKAARSTRASLVHQIWNMRRFHRSYDKEKYKRAADLAVEVVNSELFKEAFFDDDVVFTETKKKTKEEIYNHLISGKDLYGGSDRDIDIDVTLYWRPFSRVIGYTYGNTMRTWINKKYLRRFSEESMAGHIIHEYCHNMGYNHFGAHGSSVPYKIGNIVEDIAYEIAGQSVMA